MSSGRLSRNPKLTIGIPAYRNEKTIRATVDSILAQSYGDFQIIISDDVSPDRTADVCRSIAASDPRITFVQQPKNLNYGNFRYLVNVADTDYFMWAAGDDTVDPDFVRQNIRILQSRDDVVLSVSKAAFVKEGVVVGQSKGTYPLLGTVTQNLVRYLSRPADNSRMYGVFRTEALKRSFPARDFHAYDWAVSATSLLYGKHFEIPEIMMYRDYTPAEKYVDLALRDGSTVVSRLFPLFAMTRYLLTNSKFPLDWRVLVALTSLNMEHHANVCERLYPRYAGMFFRMRRFWQRHIGWRADPWRLE